MRARRLGPNPISDAFHSWQRPRYLRSYPLPRFHVPEKGRSQRDWTIPQSLFVLQLRSLYWYQVRQSSLASGILVLTPEEERHGEMKVPWNELVCFNGIVMASYCLPTLSSSSPHPPPEAGLTTGKGTQDHNKSRAVSFWKLRTWLSVRVFRQLTIPSYCQVLELHLPTPINTPVWKSRYTNCYSSLQPPYLVKLQWFRFSFNEIHSLYRPEVHRRWIRVPQAGQGFPWVAWHGILVECVGLLVIRLDVRHTRPLKHSFHFVGIFHAALVAMVSTKEEEIQQQHKETNFVNFPLDLTRPPPNRSS